MSIQLVPCGACARHVKVTDAVCPFCGADVATSADAAAAARAGLPPRPPGRLSRAALIAASAAGALAATDCSSSSEVPLYGAPVPPVDDGSPDGGMVQPVYGAMPIDASSGDDDGGGNAIPLYGAFPIDGSVEPQPGDAGADAASLDHDGSSIQPLYGAAIVPDGGSSGH